MNSTQLMDEKSRKRKKFRKKHLDNGNLSTNKKLDQTHDNTKGCNFKKKRKQKILEKNKDKIFPKKKNFKNISMLILNTSHTNKTDYCKINTDSDIKNATKFNDEFPVSLKAQKSLKLKNSEGHNVSLKKKSNDCINSKNIKVKKSRLHSDVSFSSAKNSKCKKKSFSDSKSFDNKSKNSSKKNFVPLKTEAENSSESDSNEDQILKNELKSFSIYRNIQKLIQDHPSLVSSANYGEGELPEAVSVKSLNEYDSEELSVEYMDSEGHNTSTDDSGEESETFLKEALMSTSNKKDKLGSRRGFDRPQVDKNEKVVASESATSSNDFKRTHKAQSVTSNLRNKALEKLQGAKFRYLNEKLYTESGKDSFSYFQKNRDEYMDYHKGYSLQAAKWPLNPVDKIISSLQKMKKNITIADMGCGDAKIGRTLSSSCTIHSFDLVALNDFVTPCNISKVPLPNESVDVVVFCLSLMGINLKEYLQEAYRIAKFGGILKIAEVESRIPNLELFIKSIQSLGFSVEKRDVEHKLFVFLEFKKMKKSKKCAEIQDITLKPCLYKKR